MFKLIAITLLSLIVSDSQSRPVLQPSLLSEANNHLGFSLLNNLYDNQKNVFFSPLSLSTAFAMLYSGAKGTTAQEMRRVLGYESTHLTDEQLFKPFAEVMQTVRNIGSKNNGIALKMANKAVVQKNFEVLKSFQDSLRHNFESDIQSVDFSDRKVTEEINQWVSEETNEKIKKLFDGPLDASTKLVLLNAIYFRGVFQTKFDAKKTTEEVFFTVDNQQKKTQMMKRLGKFNFTQIPELQSSLLEIPYTSDDISLYVVLPDQRQAKVSVLPLIEPKKPLDIWSEIEKAINTLEERQVDVVIPKFKVETSYSLKETLTQMGMESVFTPSADLSGIDGKKDLEVSEVVHKAFVEINEEGTEAAAATGIAVRTSARVGSEPMIPVFRADHPFMFFIRDNISGMNLFVGQINQV